jgi:hypothetical protein
MDVGFHGGLAKGGSPFPFETGYGWLDVPQKLVGVSISLIPICFIGKHLVRICGLDMWGWRWIRSEM